MGFAAIPGAGKSTLASRLPEALDQLRPGSALVAPMDGFHLPNRRLDELGLRPWKGAPRTCDAGAYIQTLRHMVDAGSTCPTPCSRKPGGAGRT